jgi:multidrug efflux pump subunit AcrA (membrane-fusion protein)
VNANFAAFKQTRARTERAGNVAGRQAAGLEAKVADLDRENRELREKLAAALEAAEAQARTTSAALEVARARVKQSRASLSTTEVDLSRTRIVSPIDGIVVLRAIEPGQTVAASFQAPVLFRIARDFDRVKVKISVDEADIGGVKEGQAVTFSVDAFPDQVFDGVVTQVRKQPVMEQNVVAYTVMAEAQNTGGRLMPGMTANADIVIQRRDGVLKVPVAALRWAPPAEVQAAPRGPPGTPIRNDSGPAYPGSVPVQKVVEVHAGSSQSVFPLRSSSTALSQISGLVAHPGADAQSVSAQSVLPSPSSSTMRGSSGSVGSDSFTGSSRRMPTGVGVAGR